MFNQKQAIGVEYIIGADQNNLQRALVKREVLLCAGAIASPQILQRSGVGQSTFLKSMDIDVVHDCRAWVKTCRSLGNVLTV